MRGDALEAVMTRTALLLELVEVRVTDSRGTEEGAILSARHEELLDAIKSASETGDVPSSEFVSELRGLEDIEVNVAIALTRCEDFPRDDEYEGLLAWFQLIPESMTAALAQALLGIHSLR